MDLDNDSEKELISEAIGLVSKKWHSRIIYHLLKENRSNFSGLKGSIGDVSNKVLSESLKDLREKDLVEKVEDGGSAEYRLTQKGKDLEDVFEDLADWAEKYLAEQKPEVLIVEDNEQQARMYKRWLEPAYEAYTANTRSEVFENVSEDTEVVLLDRKLPETSAEELLKSSDILSGKQVIMITGVEPDVELVQLSVDDYLLKPVSRKDLRNSVDHVIKAARGTEDIKELSALLSKKKVLDRKPRSVRETDEYKELVSRIEELKQKMDGVPDLVEETA